MFNNEFFIAALLILGGFLLGSIPFCRIVPKIIMKKDICELSDDGNPGAANVFVHCNVIMGLFCLLLDIGKGFLPVFAAYKWIGCDNILFSGVMIAPVLGHALGAFNKFKGGKCIATIFGVMIALLPVSRAGLVLAFIYIFFAGVLRVKPNSKCSVLSFTCFLMIAMPILIYQSKIPIAIGCFVMACLAIAKHIKSLPKRSPEEAKSQ